MRCEGGRLRWCFGVDPFSESFEIDELPSSTAPVYGIVGVDRSKAAVYKRLLLVAANYHVARLVDSLMDTAREQSWQVERVTTSSSFRAVMSGEIAAECCGQILPIT